MTSLIFTVATDIYRIYSEEKDKNYCPQHLPQSALILFQRFKKAYESKNIKELKDCISSDFRGDIYGKNQADLIKFMTYNFQFLKYGFSPHLIIEVFNICSSSDSEFSTVINMKANLQFFGITTPVNWDRGKLLCEAKPEGKYSYWRITKIMKFKE
ncbi:MAG: hypothetical protein QNJ55_01985 [Xenococcus sp. MO_188.B8]|nr:hypothetical protein [Xenococcus sp. MO_188.B8]